MGTGSQIPQIVRGHWLMALCCVLYLVWWCVFFWPRDASDQPAGLLRASGVACILGAAVAGVLAVWSTCSAVASMHGAVDGLWINVGGIVAYGILLWVTAGPLGRQPTTELILFVGWLVLELNVASALAGSAAVAPVVVIIVVALAIVAFVISLVCYVLYYGLPAWPSFIDGCVPLATIGIVEAVLAIVIAAA